MVVYKPDSSLYADDASLNTIATLQEKLLEYLNKTAVCFADDIELLQDFEHELLSVQRKLNELSIETADLNEIIRGIGDIRVKVSRVYSDLTNAIKRTTENDISPAVDVYLRLINSIIEEFAESFAGLSQLIDSAQNLIDLHIEAVELNAEDMSNIFGGKGGILGRVSQLVGRAEELGEDTPTELRIVVQNLQHYYESLTFYKELFRMSAVVFENFPVPQDYVQQILTAQNLAEES